MDDHDPISQFFPDDEDVDLYAVLSLTEEASLDDIKKSYRRFALLNHPDKHVNSSEEARNAAALKFQQVGFAYAVLSDEKRRKRYDTTGKTDEGFELGAGEDGWEAYFEELFEKVTKGRLDELKKEYQGSAEEITDVRSAYLETEGSIDEILARIPHSNYTDEPRFIEMISKAIKDGELIAFPAWEASLKDEKAKSKRKKTGEKEAKEAEETAKELGVWDEFYGSGKPGQRKAKGKKKAGNGKETEQDGAEAEDDEHAALRALIQKNRSKMNSVVDSLAAKYGGESNEGGRGKKRAKGDDGGSKKKAKVAAAPEIDDDEFEKLQQSLFGEKASAS
ncbi:DnaJ-domain-containing protein, partial [Sistotremastrum niveocremeum HHB9708]